MQTITLPPPKRSWFSLISWAVLLAVLVISWKGAEMDPLLLFRDSGNMATFAADFFPPDFSQWQDYLGEMAVTLQIAVWGTALAVVLSIPFGLVGGDIAARVRDIAIALYRFASEHAAARGLIIADTKFEFGLDDMGRIHLIDEALTPDSSRFWPADTWRAGTSPPSFDKQFVRDYLESIHWDKKPPAPRLPADIIARTSEKYREALARITGPATR